MTIQCCKGEDGYHHPMCEALEAELLHDRNVFGASITRVVNDHHQRVDPRDYVVLVKQHRPEPEVTLEHLEFTITME